MQISFSESVRKMIKWYKKLFFHMLDVSMLNAYILYKEKKQVTLQFTDFRLQVIRQILDKYGSQRDPRRGRPSTDKPLRLTARHFPSLTSGGKRRCIVCSTTVKRQKKTISFQVRMFRLQCRLMHSKLFSRLSYFESILINLNEKQNQLILEILVFFFSQKNNPVLKGLKNKCDID